METFLPDWPLCSLHAPKMATIGPGLIIRTKSSKHHMIPSHGYRPSRHKRKRAHAVNGARMYAPVQVPCGQDAQVDSVSFLCHFMASLTAHDKCREIRAAAPCWYCQYKHSIAMMSRPEPPPARLKSDSQFVYIYTWPLPVTNWRSASQ